MKEDKTICKNCVCHRYGNKRCTELCRCGGKCGLSEGDRGSSGESGGARGADRRGGVARRRRRRLRIAKATNRVQVVTRCSSRIVKTKVCRIKKLSKITPSKPALAMHT